MTNLAAITRIWLTEAREEFGLGWKCAITGGEKLNVNKPETKIVIRWNEKDGEKIPQIGIPKE